MRSFCLAAWLVPVVQLGTGSYGCSGVESRTPASHARALPFILSTG
jgi:hypothetical protein